MPTDAKQLDRINALQAEIEQLLGFDADSEIATTEDHDESYGLVLTEEAAQRVVDRLRSALTYTRTASESKGQ